MAHLEKYTDDSVIFLLKHNHRLIQNNKNSDIDILRSEKGNYCLSPRNTFSQEEYFSNRRSIQKQELDYYKKRKSEVYIYNRKNVNTVCSWLVTCPREITNEKEQKRFFEETASFLTQRYGEENTISIAIHQDEGHDVAGSSDNPKREGRAHMHFLFMPVVKIDHEALAKKRTHIKAMDEFDEKISFSDRMNRAEYRSFHNDFQNFIDSKGFRCRVFNDDGIEQSKKIYLTVEQLKDLSDHGITVPKTLTTDRLIEILKTVNINAGDWGNTDSWERERDWESEAIEWERD